MPRSIFAALLVLPLAGAAQAGVEEGLAAYQRYDYAAALREWLPLAEQSSTAAQFHLGEMYRQGRGVAYDTAEAIRWYRMAAEHGHPGAQFQLASFYRSGRGVPVDLAEAAEWSRRAAEQGSVAAMGLLGSLYRAGEGVPQDVVQAHKWYALAIAQGDDVDGFLAKVELRKLVERMTPSQLAEAQRLARAWRPHPEAEAAEGSASQRGDKDQGTRK